MYRFIPDESINTFLCMGNNFSQTIIESYLGGFFGFFYGHIKLMVHS